MSKGQTGGEKTKEFAGNAAGEESKKPDSKRHDAPPKGKANAPIGGGCVASGCKSNATRFNFCEEHYDHFKFGLIKKTGEPVSDYEKKIEHYAAYKAKQKGTRKAA